MPGRNLAAWFLLRRVTFSWAESHQRPTKGRSLWKPHVLIVILPGCGPCRPWAWWGGLDGWAHLWVVSTLLIASTPSTRASSLGVAASPGRCRPGCATGRAENRRTAHHPSSDREKENFFLPGMANALRPDLGSNSFPPRKAGWIPQGGGRPRLWRFFPRFLIAEKSGPAERVPLARLASPCQPPKKRSLRLPGCPTLGLPGFFSCQECKFPVK